MYGVGYNEPIEGEKVYRAYENGKPTRCYYTWRNILERCYSDKLHTKEPTYKDVIVAEEYRDVLPSKVYQALMNYRMDVIIG